MKTSPSRSRSRRASCPTYESGSAGRGGPPSPEAPWAQGTDIDYLRDLLAYWAHGFDWREQERRLNAVDHFRADVDGVRITTCTSGAVGCR